MNRLIYKCKNNKLFCSLVLYALLVLLFDLFLVIFDVVQLVKLSKNSVDLMNGFSAVNITAGMLNGLVIVFIALYLIFSTRKINVDISKNNKK